MISFLGFPFVLLTFYVHILVGNGKQLWGAAVVGVALVVLVLLKGASWWSMFEVLLNKSHGTNRIKLNLLYDEA